MPRTVQIHPSDPVLVGTCDPSHTGININTFCQVPSAAHLTSGHSGLKPPHYIYTSNGLTMIYLAGANTYR